MASESSFTFLLSRTKGMSAPIRALDEIQEQKHNGLSAPLQQIYFYNVYIIIPYFRYIKGVKRNVTEVYLQTTKVFH
ncbi:hypothetical protein CA598_04205 [Paenibacillus sp. VTT E-133291]|nr:hypothetical protein CA598_04205 [Paenibacillus sp. VTT E-133291]